MEKIVSGADKHWKFARNGRRKRVIEIESEKTWIETRE